VIVLHFATHKTVTDRKKLKDKELKTPQEPWEDKNGRTLN